MNAKAIPFIIALACVTGCSELPKRDAAKVGPFYTPTNVTALGQLPAELRRVVVLPCWSNAQVPEENFERIDQAIRAELNRTGLFETVTISRQEMRQIFGSRTVSSTAALPPDLFQRLVQRTAADGVLFTDVTEYDAYPPLSLGLRFKLAEVATRQIVWAADNMFSAADPSVANSARRHALLLGTDRGPGDLSHTILQNPTRFAAYAAAESFQTLPRR